MIKCTESLMVDSLMKNVSFTVSLMGLGKIGLLCDLNRDRKYVLSHSRAFNKNKNFKLISGYDPEIKKTKIFSNSYDVPGFTKFDDYLKYSRADIFVISSPTKYHYDNITKLLSYHKPIAIMCEKPMSQNLKEAKEIVGLCKKHKVPLELPYHLDF